MNEVKPAVDGRGREYGWKCCGKAGHVWTQKADAEKCCNGFVRCLAVHPAPIESGLIASVNFYWSPTDGCDLLKADGGEA